MGGLYDSSIGRCQWANRPFNNQFAAFNNIY